MVKTTKEDIKDFYDLYWLIKNRKMNKDVILNIIEYKIFEASINAINILENFFNHIGILLSNEYNLKVVNISKNNCKCLLYMS